MKYEKWTAAFAILTVLGPWQRAHAAKIYVLDSGGFQSAGNYTVSQELNELSIGAEKGHQAALSSSKGCRVGLENAVALESEEAFQKRILTLKTKVEKDEAVFVGFTRSSSAKTVALLLKGTKAKGISAGAAADLHSINPEFFSVAFPLSEQWKKTKEIFSSLKCGAVYGIFPSLTGYSSQLKTFFTLDKAGKVVEKIDLAKEFPKNSCFFFGSNFSESIDEFSTLIHSTRPLAVIGTGDWSLSEPEVKKVISKMGVKINLYAVLGFPPGGYEEIPQARKLKKAALNRGIHDPSPILAYAFDAAFLATQMLCRHQAPAEALNAVKSSLIRKYQGVGPTGNLTGPFFAHQIQAERTP